MEYYATKNQRLSPFVEQLAVIREIMAELPDSSLITCHTVSRAFCPFLRGNWRVADGHFAHRGMCHGWLWHRDQYNLEHEEPRELILDIYPVAGTGPILVACGYPSPWSNLYMEDNFYHARSVSVFDDHAKVLTGMIKETKGFRDL